jgi:hypothetical protein
MINFYNELRIKWADKMSKKSKLDEQFETQSNQLFINIEKAKDEYEEFLTQFILDNSNSDIDELYDEEELELWEATSNSDYRQLTSLEVLESVVTTVLLRSIYKKSKISSIKVGA